MTPITLEVAIETADDAVAAFNGGADRLELSSALPLGGLTPSIGSVLEVQAAVPLPILIMIRPRAGGFEYTDREFRSMLRDVEHFAGLSPAGFVFGILDSRGMPDPERNRQLLQHCQPVRGIFHRAFDSCPNLSEAAHILVELGFVRVLTSAGAHTAAEGIPALAKLHSEFGSRLGVLPGGGVRATNAEAILQQTGCREVHGSFSIVDGTGQLRTSQSLVEACRDRLNHFASFCDAGANPPR